MLFKIIGLLADGDRSTVVDNPKFLTEKPLFFPQSTFLILAAK